MKKENAIKYLRTLGSSTKLDTCSVTTQYSMWVVLGNYSKESGENSCSECFFFFFPPPVVSIVKSAKTGKILYLIVNIWRNSMVILPYPETWGSEKKIPREWDDYSHQGSALLVIAAVVYIQVLDFGLLWLQFWFHGPCVVRSLLCMWFSYSFHRCFVFFSFKFIGV